MTYDINTLINDRLAPMLVSSVYNYTMDPVFSVFGKETKTRSGDVITHILKTANTSNNAAYDKSSVDVAAGQQTLNFR